MIFFSIFCTLVIDHFKPMRMNNPVLLAVQDFANRIELWFNAGHPHHGRIGWFVLILGITIPIFIIYWICLYINLFLAMGFNIVVLYFCMGFRDYGKYFTSIQIALIVGDELKAKELLAEWSGRDTSGMEATEIIRLSIERALLTTHQHVFGVFFWFALPFIGPAGAVFYRLSAYLLRAWTENKSTHDKKFGLFAEKAFYWIDWIPSRLTAIVFAVVGNFEDAIFAWRNFSGRWENKNTGILLSTGGGALGVRLGTPHEKAVEVIPVDVTEIDSGGLETESQPGEEPAPRYFENTTGLIWRALLLWLLLFLFFTILVWLL